MRRGQEDREATGRPAHGLSVRGAVARGRLAAFLLLPTCALFGAGEARDVGPAVRAMVREEWLREEPRVDARAALARARALLARFDAERTPARQTLAAALDALEARIAATAESPEARRATYLDSRALLRRVAFANPLLGFDKLLFVTRHDSAGVYHMCDQYYGCNARPGGALCVLLEPFGDAPKLVDVLAGAVVANGRLAGQALAGGAFLSPEVSFDGRTIFFAWTEAKAFARTRGAEAYLWSPEYSHHIFKVGADGANLVQLTDGAWDDFDPCELPGGRVAFVSLRRGGYLRCGRHCPVYTLFSMTAEGGDIVPLSYHETHEWHPSVTNDGMLVYTRWDYVDRDTNVAHHIWTCFPDGRDPRSFHGNYPVKREARPWMEMAIRAIPNSPKFVACTGAHHGQEFGSLVVIDPRAEDDNALAQVTRLTPDVLFPEAEGRPIEKYACYGTPWPLGEDDFLCVYDEAAKNRGIYWIDRAGNRELIYRDPAISCVSPMPLGPRPRPPVIPARTVQTAEDLAAAGGAAPPATIALANVYESDFKWPQGAEVARLRIIQVLPKTTAPPNVPRIGVAEQTNARAVLGSVPVERDGSAYFEAPAGKELYFQALDARGLAIQSMRSGTYLHPGERLVCQGCHERKHRTPPPRAAVPLAFSRPPSPIERDVDGSNPFSFVRLVQPALDRNCVACHREKNALDLSGAVEAPHGWTRSYRNLAPEYGFFFHVSNGAILTGAHGGSRTVAGKFGAAASKLLPYLGEAHHGVRLPAEDFHRITLWLDCNSEFFGCYERTDAQSRGEVVRPTLD